MKKNLSLNKNNGKAKIAVLIGVGLLILLFPQMSSPQLMTLAILGLIGAMQTLGLNIFLGYCGQINFGTAGFFAIGGYSVALMEKYLNTPFFINLVVGMIIAWIVALVMSIALVRLREHSLALGTLAFALGIYTLVARGLKSYTGGEDGINLAPLMFPDGSKATDTFYYFLVVVMILGICWLSWTMIHSRIGRAMTEISQNEKAAKSFGVEINKYLRLGLVLNAIICSVAGSIFIKWVGWISPEYYGVMANIIVLLALIVGGRGSILGAIVGGIFMFILPQLMINFAEWSMLTYGLILCVFVRFLPKGIVGELQSLYLRRKNNFSVE